MKSLFLTDCDDVLLDWTLAFSKYMEKHHPEYGVDKTAYSLGLSQEDQKKFVVEFNQSPEFALMEPFRDSVEFVHKIHDLGYNFVVISTCMGSNYTRIMREQNLIKVFGKGIFKTIHCLPLYTSKKTTLAKYKPTFWVDDKLSHCIDASVLGHTSFEMLTPVASKEIRPTNISSVQKWREIYENILAIKK